MSRTEVTYLIVGIAAALSLGAWIALIAVPAWRSYTVLWHRIVAIVASGYVFAAIVAAGAGGGALFLYLYGEI